MQCGGVIFGYNLANLVIDSLAVCDQKGSFRTKINYWYPRVMRNVLYNEMHEI